MNVALVLFGTALMILAILNDPWGTKFTAAAVYFIGAALWVIGVAGV